MENFRRESFATEYLSRRRSFTCVHLSFLSIYVTISPLSAFLSLFFYFIVLFLIQAQFVRICLKSRSNIYFLPCENLRSDVTETTRAAMLCTAAVQFLSCFLAAVLAKTVGSVNIINSNTQSSNSITHNSDTVGNNTGINSTTRKTTRLLQQP